MHWFLAQSDHVPDNSALLRRRSRPYVVVIDEHLHVAFAEPEALALFQAHASCVCHYVRTFLARDDEASVSGMASPLPGLFIRIIPLAGPGGTFYGLFFEREQRREDLKDAVERFAFTPREVDVLDRILDGMNASEIADDLCIAEATVFDHFKHITCKTKARNRADMLAKIFNWQPSLKPDRSYNPGIDRRTATRRI